MQCGKYTVIKNGTKIQSIDLACLLVNPLLCPLKFYINKLTGNEKDFLFVRSGFRKRGGHGVYFMFG